MSPFLSLWKCRPHQGLCWKHLPLLTYKIHFFSPVKGWSNMSKAASVFMNQKENLPKYLTILQKVSRLLIFYVNEDPHPERNKAEPSTVAERERQRASDTCRGERGPIWGQRDWRLTHGQWICRGCLEVRARVPRGLRRGQKSEWARQKEGKSEQVFIAACCRPPSFHTRVSQPLRCSSLQPCRNTRALVSSSAAPSTRAVYQT